MPGIMILGPSLWLDPENVSSDLAETPLDARRHLAAMGLNFLVDSFVMEDQEQAEGETHTDLFRRLVVEHDVQSFLVVLPIGCRLHGLEKEFGALLEWMAQGWLRPEQVFVLAEKATWHESNEGAMGALSEPGNRTRYHDDLVAYDVRVRVWDDGNSLDAHAISAFAETRSAPCLPWYDHLIRA